MGSMGLCSLASPGAVFKRKFRWRFTLFFECDGRFLTFNSINAYSGSRPKMRRDETEVSYLGQKYALPGNIVTYEPLELSLYDVTGIDGLKNLYYWIAAYMRMGQPYSGLTPDSPGFITLDLLNGCGEVIESWDLADAWPSAVDFGDLDMSSSDVCMIGLTIRYNLATLTLPDETCQDQEDLPTCCGEGTSPADTDIISKTPVTVTGEIPDVSPLPPSDNIYTGNYSTLELITAPATDPVPNSTKFTLKAKSIGPIHQILLNVFWQFRGITLWKRGRSTLYGDDAIQECTVALYLQPGVPLDGYCAIVNVTKDRQTNTDTYESE